MDPTKNWVETVEKAAEFVKAYDSDADLEDLPIDDAYTIASNVLELAAWVKAGNSLLILPETPIASVPGVTE